jgi:hypothetical protein
VSLWNWPPAHFKQLEAEAGLNVPEEQLTHEAAPVADWEYPAAQAVHEAAPDPDDDPARQDEQEDAPVLLYQSRPHTGRRR